MSVRLIALNAVSLVSIVVAGGSTGSLDARLGWNYLTVRRLLASLVRLRFMGSCAVKNPALNSWDLILGAT